MKKSKKEAFISRDELYEIYDDLCGSYGIECKDEEFDEFVNHINIDVYDWVAENFRSFTKRQQSDFKM